MNDKQQLALLEIIEQELKKTTLSYKEWKAAGGKGGHWQAALRGINKLQADLQPPKIALPDLGPLWKGGKSVLAHQLTHKTSGIDYYPAYDDAFVEGMPIYAVENLVVSRTSSSRPGLAFYAAGDSDLKYWYGHLDRTHSPGKRFKKGVMVGRVCRNSIGGGPHTHLGINIEQLFGREKQLLYGKTGRGPDYTFGSPTVGVQLRKLISQMEGV